MNRFFFKTHFTLVHIPKPGGGRQCQCNNEPSVLYNNLQCFFVFSNTTSQWQWGTYLPGGSSAVATADKENTNFCPANATSWTIPLTCGKFSIKREHRFVLHYSFIKIWTVPQYNCYSSKFGRSILFLESLLCLL